MTGEIEQLYRSDYTIVGNCNNVLFVFALGTPIQNDIDAVARISSRLIAQRCPSGLGLLLCTRAGAKPPDAEKRERMISVFRQLAPRTQAMAWVVLGQGFMPAAVRSIFAAVTLTIRATYPMKVFSDLPVGIAWLTAQMEGLDGARFDRETLADRASVLATASLPPPAASAR